jgi:hypothetical protein
MGLPEGRGGKGRGKFTLQISTLLLPEARTRLLHAAGERDLDVLGHDLLGPRHGAGGLGLADHLLDPLDAPVALVEAPCDVLGQALDVPLLGLLGALVVEAGQDVLLVQALELLGAPGDVGEELRHLVGDVGPARRQAVHLDDGVPVVVVVAAREEPAPVRGLVGREEHGAPGRGGGGGGGGGAEALGGCEVCAAAILVPVRGVVGVGLSVGEISGERWSPMSATGRWKETSLPSHAPLCLGYVMDGLAGGMDGGGL